MELWPLIDVRISFPLNIFTKKGQNLTNSVYALILSRSRLGLLPVTYVSFCKFAAELWPLIDRNSDFYGRLAF